MASHTFTRQELYELVWAEPMIKLAARYKISGNGLAKACRRANVPVPPRGYWAKLQAGQKVSKAPLPKAKLDTPPRVTIEPLRSRPALPEPPPVPATVVEKIEEAQQSGKPVTVPTTLSSPHRVIAAWLAEERHTSRYGSIYGRSHRSSPKSDLEKRRLRILSALFKALEKRGYKIIAGEMRQRDVQIAHGDEKLEVKLTERIRQVRRQLTDEDRTKGHYGPNQTWTQERVPSGELVLKISHPNRYGVSKEWRDEPDTPLESALTEVAAQLAGMFEELRLRRIRETEKREQEWKIAEERRREEMQAKRETIRFSRLLAHSENLRQAVAIRELVSAVETSPLATEEPDRFTSWKAWALGHAERIDPLSGADLFDQEVSDYEVYTLRE